MLQIEDVTLSVGARDLLVGASLHIHPGEKVGLVGRNGAGKTSLLRLIASEILPDSGAVRVRAGATVGTLPQHAVSGAHRSVWEETSSHMERFKALSEAMETARRDVEAGVAGAVARLGDATEAFRLAGGFAIDERIGEVLHGLGFGPDTWHRPCDSFSGGWQMRIALARLLLSEPTLMLLDEPTNHLDLLARSWLARFLRDHPSTLIVVSHDRHLLDQVTRRTVEIRGRALHAFKGNLSAWLRERELRRVQEQASYDAQQGEVARLERFVERFKAKATKAAQARSRQRQLDRMELQDAPEREKTHHLALPEPPGSSQVTIAMRGVTLGWDAETDVLTGVDLELHRGQRIAVIGPNGGGKSTLVAGLVGALLPRVGRRRVGEGVRIGLFSQDLAAQLPADLTPVEIVEADAIGWPTSRVRGVLGAVGLEGDTALRPVGLLTGGERARVALARFVVRPYNVLLLDEPSNHLDIVTVEMLADALADFEGAMVLVSHDRFLVERVATHVAHVRDGTVALSEGVRPEDFEPPPPPGQSAARDEAAAEAWEDRKQRRRAEGRARKRIEAIGGEVERAEADMEALEAKMFEVAADYAASAALEADRRTIQARIDALYQEWEALEAELLE